jgi:hypothetical protein
MIKMEKGKVHLTEQTSSILINNAKVKGSEKVANTFNHFFLTITESLNLHKEGEDVVSFLQDFFPH